MSFCLPALLASWTAAAPAQEDKTGGGTQTSATDELPLLDASKAMDLARRLMDGGQPQQAFELLRRLMQAARAEGDIDTANIRFLAAQALLKTGRPAHAAVVLGQLAAERPELDRVRLDYAVALAGEHEFDLPTQPCPIQLVGWSIPGDQGADQYVGIKNDPHARRSLHHQRA